MAYCGANKSLPSVPRSRGCINCVARRSKCDARQPTCKACEDRMQICRGYRRKEFVFLAEGWRAPGVAAQSRPRNGCNPSHRQHPIHDVYDTVMTSDPVPESSAMIASSRSREIPAERIPLSRSISPDPIQTYVGFFLAQFTTNLPREAYFFLSNCRRSFARLLDKPDANAGRNAPCLGDPLMNASEALVKGHFAKLHGSTQLLHESIRSYSVALKSLSVGLEDVKSIGVPSLREEDWIDLIFSCILLAFWELSINPDSLHWQDHIRGLAFLVEGRGPKLLKSSPSIQMIGPLRLIILLESISSKKPCFLAQREWHGFPGFCFHPALSSELHSAINRGEAELEISGIGPVHYLDFVLERLVKISTIVAALEEVRRASRSLEAPRYESQERVQCILQDALEVLQQMEAVLSHLQPNNDRLFPAEQQHAEVVPIQTDASQNSISSYLDSFMTGYITTPGRFAAYNVTNLCRTAAMSVRLIICQLLRLQGARNFHSLEEQRAALLLHVESVLRAVPYGSRKDILEFAPISFVPAFRVAHAVLVRECEILRGEGGKEIDLANCQRMMEILQRHLDFVASRKIPIKIDL